MSQSEILERHGVDTDRARALLADAVMNADDGELYLEAGKSQSMFWDDGRLKSASYSSDQGFGLRVVAGAASGYAHAGEVSLEALNRAAEAARAAKRNHSGVLDVSPAAGAALRYRQFDPVAEGPGVTEQAALLAEIDAYLRASDPRVVQVSASLSASSVEVEILRADGFLARDLRPLVRLNVSVTVEKAGRRESGSSGCGGRTRLEDWITPSVWKGQADEALRKALVNLDAVDIKGGEMDVVLGPGWPAVLLHEAVGHGLEGDFNRKGVSAFSGRIGQQVAAKGVTVVDDGTLPDRRGSLSFDDEGTPTSRTVLIEDGILVGYMQDRQNARLMAMAPTGNARRESFAAPPMPRMTNTIMLGGQDDPAEIIASLDNGVYAPDFGGGQVDITSGKFVFRCTEAYKVENGKIVHPIKGVTLIGDGPTALTKITRIGNDMAMDTGVGVCGKGGQSVPVGVGQPTLKLTGLTVGGAG